MEIKGFQKVTLIDYPKKIACTLFLFGCNFKCGFCHNPELVLPTRKEEKTYSQKEIIDYLEKRKEYLNGICITGGEPLLSIDKEFLMRIKKLGYGIKIDTNGAFPEKLKELLDEDLVDFVAMDIKASRENYEKVTNSIVELQKIENCIILIATKAKDYEFRTTVIEGIHNVNDMKNLAAWLFGITKVKMKKFCLQGFKNSGKFVSEEFKTKKDTKKEYLDELKEAIKDYFEEVEVRV